MWAVTVCRTCCAAAIMLSLCSPALKKRGAPSRSTRSLPALDRCDRTSRDNHGATLSNTFCTATFLRRWRVDDLLWSYAMVSLTQFMISAFQRHLVSRLVRCRPSLLTRDVVTWHLRTRCGLKHATQATSRCEIDRESSSLKNRIGQQFMHSQSLLAVAVRN